MFLLSLLLSALLVLPVFGKSHRHHSSHNTHAPSNVADTVHSSPADTNVNPLQKRSTYAFDVCQGLSSPLQPVGGSHAGAKGAYGNPRGAGTTKGGSTKGGSGRLGGSKGGSARSGTQPKNPAPGTYIPKVESKWDWINAFCLAPWVSGEFNVTCERSSYAGMIDPHFFTAEITARCPPQLPICVDTTELVRGVFQWPRQLSTDVICVKRNSVHYKYLKALQRARQVWCSNVEYLGNKWDKIRRTFHLQSEVQVPGRARGSYKAAALWFEDDEKFSRPWTLGKITNTTATHRYVQTRPGQISGYKFCMELEADHVDAFMPTITMGYTITETTGTYGHWSHGLEDSTLDDDAGTGYHDSVTAGQGSDAPTGGQITKTGAVDALAHTRRDIASKWSRMSSILEPIFHRR